MEARGTYCPFDSLPNDLVLRILVEAAGDHRTPVGFAQIEKLSQLKVLCSRFADLIPQVEGITWNEDKVDLRNSGAERFLKDCQMLKALQLLVAYDYNPDSASAGTHLVLDEFLLSISGATPWLEEFKVFGSIRFPPKEVLDHLSDRTPVEEATELYEIFRTMALCPRLRMLSLSYHSNNEPGRAPSIRHPLKSLTSLELIETNLTGLCLQNILTICPHLETLDLSQSSGEFEKLTIALNKLNTLIFDSDSLLVTRLEIHTPQLRHLTLEAYITEVSICSPELVELHINLQECKIIKESPWKVSTVHIGSSPGSQEDLLEYFRLCKDARVVRIGKRDCIFEDFYIGQVELLKLLQPFQNLEELDIPGGMVDFLTPEQPDSFLPTFSGLKSLRVTLGESIEQFERCLTFARAATKLEWFVADLDNLDEEDKNAVQHCKRLLLDIQERHPYLRLDVIWP